MPRQARSSTVFGSGVSTSARRPRELGTYSGNAEEIGNGATAFGGAGRPEWGWMAEYIGVPSLSHK